MGALCERVGIAALAFGAVLAAPARSWADNPIIQTNYTADPAPMLHGDTVYLCTSHDEDVTVDNFFTMNDWRVYSSRDMVNWTDHGSPLSYRTFSWATGKAWAPQCVERDGKFYFYVPVSDAIGVAVADSPLGPYEDAIGRPLVSNYQYIDPTVYVDADGQAYLYFGNPRLWYVRLNDDMISYSGQIEQIPNTTESFGQRSGDADRPTLYEEGPWFTRRDDLYYMLFAMGPLPERIGYATSSGPLGPWAYRGVIMENQSGHAFTNHAGVVDLGGRSFFFYHTQELPGGGGFKRSVALEEFTYNADGSIPTITKTSAGVTEAVRPLIPYERVEAETIAWEVGIETEPCSEGGMNVTDISNGDYIKVEQVEFGGGADAFEYRVASGSGGGAIELRLDSENGTLVATCSVASTGGDQSWATQSCTVSGATGQHDLFLRFTGGGFKLDWWQFAGPGEPGTGGAGGAGGAPGSGGVSVGGSDTGGAAGAPGSGGVAVGGGGLGGGQSGGTAGSGGVAVGGGGLGGGQSGGTAGSGGASGGAGVGGSGPGGSGVGGLAGSGGAAVGGTMPSGGSGVGGGLGGGGTGVGGGGSGGVVGSGGAAVSGGGPGVVGGTSSGGSTVPATGGAVDPDLRADGSEDDGGCSCRLAPASANGAAGSALVWVGLAGLLRRRRRSLLRGGI